MVAYMYAPKRFLGQARGIKGHEDFIDAMAIVRRRDDRVMGVCIGGAWDGARSYEAKLRAYGSKRLGEGMRFLGTRDDVLELYADLDAAVHPSHSENVGGAVESLLSGVPTITSDVGGFPDLVIPGRTGRLVPPRDPESLAAAILETLSNRAAAWELARRGREKAAAMFDSRFTTRQIKEIYHHVLSP
jgi:glycosyltransferase involved in cell wall biosynthesis